LMGPHIGQSICNLLFLFGFLCRFLTLFACILLVILLRWLVEARESTRPDSDRPVLIPGNSHHAIGEPFCYTNSLWFIPQCSAPKNGVPTCSAGLFVVDLIRRPDLPWLGSAIGPEGLGVLKSLLKTNMILLNPVPIGWFLSGPFRGIGCPPPGQLSKGCEPYTLNGVNPIHEPYTRTLREPYTRFYLR
jgi:hypothetical protein